MTAETETQGLRRVAADRGAPVSTRPSRPLRQRLRLPLMLLGPLVVLIGAGWWYLTSGRFVSTDDAYVQAARTMITTDISGRVVEVAVRDNQRVSKGDVLFRIDDRPYRIAIEEAKAQLAAARLQVQAMKATYRQKLAEQKGAEDTLDYQQREFERQRQLATAGVASRATYDQVQNALQTARMKVTSSQSDAANMLAQLGGNPDLPVDDHPTVQRAQAALEKAQLDLSYTVVRSSESGIVTKVDQLQVGSYVTASQPVFAMISKKVWIEANFKETELTHMQPGQEATVEIDTYPGVEFHGKVESLSPATGAKFALLPPDNATGNFTKVVQRLPVRIAVDGGANPTHPLRPGMSVNVTITTD